MENNILKELIENSSEIKKLKEDVANGGVPDLSKIMPLVMKIPKMFDESISKMSKADQKKYKKEIDSYRDSIDISKVLSNLYADNSK